MLIYFSQTGNTQLLAQAIKKNVENSDIVYVGFWTDKGNANKEALDYLKTLHHQKIFLFGTAGFGKSDDYFKKIIDKVKESIDESNEVVGSFMCQGKMPETVLQRYLKLKEGNHAPDNINLLIDNYYEALKHPNNDDIENLKNEKVLAQYDELEVSYTNLKTATAITLNGSDVKETKLRLSKLVREVDKCIALLNE